LLASAAELMALFASPSGMGTSGGVTEDALSGAAVGLVAAIFATQPRPFYSASRMRLRLILSSARARARFAPTSEVEADRMPGKPTTGYSPSASDVNNNNNHKLSCRAQVSAYVFKPTCIPLELLGLTF